MDDINDAVVQLKVIRRTKPKLTKNLTKNLTKTEQKEQNMFYKKYNNVCLHLNRLKRWRDQKKSKYYKNPSDLSTDIINLITNKYSTIKDVENMYFILIKSRCFSVIRHRLEEIVETENNNKNNDEQNDALEELNVIDNIIKETDEKIIEIILNILKEINNKFHLISEKIISDTLSSTHYIGDSNDIIIKFFKDNGYKIKTKKIFESLLTFFNHNFIDIIDFEKINIDNEILEKMLYSGYMHNTHYQNLEKIYDLVKNNKDINLIDKLIEMLSNITFYESQDVHQKLFNIFNFIIKINPIRCLEILQHIPFIVFAENYFDDEFNLYDDNFDIKNMINKLKTNIANSFNMYVDKINLIKIDKIYNIKTFGDIDDKIVKELYSTIHPIIVDKKTKISRRRRRNILKNIDTNTNDIYYNFIDELSYNFYGKIFTGLDIKGIYNIIRRTFFDFIKDKFIKEKDIANIINCVVFRYNNFLLNSDEKINLFKNIFSGKITLNDITMFIINNNEVADFLITKSKVNDNLIKIAFKMCNYNFINKLVELKYNMKTSYLKYINEDKNIINILKIINKYNTLEFDDEIDWAMHIKYLNPEINISEYIYDENNEDLRTQLNEKINNDYKFNKIIKFNKMNFDEFIHYVNSNKIKISVDDLIKINDYKKRVFLLDNIKMC